MAPLRRTNATIGSKNSEDFFFVMPRMAESDQNLVLLVEDDHSLSDVTVDYLREVGFEVAVAESGREGLEMAKRCLPDVIVSDIMMQNGSGLFLLENLKRTPSTHLIPFIFVTAKDSRNDVRQGMALGADDYITKPYSMSELEASVRSQLEKREKRLSAAAVFEQRHLASMPHELRTPLNGILGITDLMRDELQRGSYPSPSELEENIGILHESGVRLLHLIENYLLYYELRLASANPERSCLYSRKSVRVPPPEDFFLSMAERHGRVGDLVVEMEAREVGINGELVWKILAEVIDNALKFSDPHKPVQICGLEEDGKYVVTIADHGVGMTEEQIESLAPFTQFDREQTEQQGLGLGLCLVRLIAEVCSLELSLTSTPGKGTLVSVGFPIRRSDAQS